MNNYNRFNDPRHIKWAKEVKQRDKFICRVCDAKNVYLNSHHINSYDKYIEQRFDVANGITLCSTCHDRFHKIFGQGNNNYIQFKEFLEIVNLIKEIVKENYEKKARRFNPRI